MTPFFQYAEDVLSEKIVTGRFIKLAVERFWRDYDKKDYEFDYKRGEKIVKFAGLCHHWKGPKVGKPIEFEPHQHFYEIQKYGWINPNTGLLRFRRSVKMIARKQYKTTEAAIESLFHMKKGIDQPAQVFTCATKEDDAVVVVNDAGRIAMCSPELKSAFKTSIHEPYVRRVICDNGSFMTYMTKGHDAVDISMGIGDECHDWPNASIKNRIESAMGNRLSPMFSTITTAGHDQEGYCFGTLRDTSIKILECVLTDEEQLILIFEMDEGDDWKDESMWVKPNPNLPYSLTHLPYLQSEFKKALNEGGTTEVNFKTKNLNLWVDAATTFIPAEVWKKNAHGGTIDRLIGRECYGGIEIVGAKYLNAFGFIFPDADGATAVKILYWMPDDYQKSKETDHYGKWIKEGYIVKFLGNVSDNDVVVKLILEEIGKYNMHSFAFKTNLENNDIVQALIKAGITGNPISHGIQGISTPTLTWEELLTAGKIEHFNNPVLAWQNACCLVKRKDNDVRLEKSGSRVVGIYAAINALAQWKTITAGPSTELGILYI